MRRKKKRPSRIGMFIEPIIEDSVKERRQRTIDLSKYNVGFEAVTNPKKRPKTPTPSKAQSTQYNKYLAKLEKGELSKFSTRDIMFFFRDMANENGHKYIIANPKIDMRNFKLALERGYSTEDILAMIEFLYTSGQKYLDLKSLHPGILLTNWCNTIYKDTQLWLDDKFDPNTKYTNKPQLNREWSDDNEEVKSNVGEWD